MQYLLCTIASRITFNNVKCSDKLFGESKVQRRVPADHVFQEEGSCRHRHDQVGNLLVGMKLMRRLNDTSK